MSPQQPFQRNSNGERIDFHGMNLVLPPDMMPPGKYPYAQNVRAYLHGRVTSRTVQGNPVQSLPSLVHSIRRLNDSTPAGPPAGYVLIAGAGQNLYAGGVQVDTGFSGNPISLVPFRPNQSVQPWMYVGDSLKMDKVRSDGRTYKMGIAEPQVAPTITSKPISAALSLIGAVSVSYWGDSPHSSDTSAYIWKNANDPSGSGPVRNSKPADGSSQGNSLQFDVTPGNAKNPMAWTTYLNYVGTVNTDNSGGSFTVSWQSGTQFGGLSAGNHITINDVDYVIASAPSNTQLTLVQDPGIQSNVSYTAVAVSGTVPLFSPALETQGFADFNMVVQATLYIPTAGIYTFDLTAFNDMIWGIGNSASGQVSLASPLLNGALSGFGQTKTVLGGYPLLPRVAIPSNTGTVISGNVQVNFSAAGNYPIEIDYDYWYHSGRTLTVSVNSQPILPLGNSSITQAQYRYVYRSSATGALSNPSPESPESSLSVLSNTVQATFSSDPQVDKIDYYRLDVGLTNYTYVGTGPNTNPPPPFADVLLDADVTDNPLLEFDNYEPFPSIDLPRSGIVNCSNGVATWVSGDVFNVRWLPGTIIIVGTVAYTLDKRPTDSHTLTATNTEIIGGVSTIVPLANGTNLPYEIAEPDLAAQPLPYMWGPTDNVNFAFAVGDPLRPGTLYWSKGNNLDSAPQTNQQDVTAPTEPLQNGCIVNGLGWVASTERAWLIYPNFFNALATVTGTVGSTWTLQEADLKRGLYIPKCLAVDGGQTVYFRSKDGIYMSNGSSGKSITDDDIYNLFPHEGFTPQPILRGPYTVYPPDDTKPQQLSCATGYLYYDYQDSNGIPRSLVYDIEAKAWVIDVYQSPAVCHALEEGPGVNGVLCGCLNGTIVPLVNPSGTVPTPPSASQITISAKCGTYIYTAGIKNASYPYDWNTGAISPVIIQCTPGNSVTLTYVSGLCNSGGTLATSVGPLGLQDDPAGRGLPFNPNRYAGEWVAAGFVPVSRMCCLGAWTDSQGNLIGLPFVVDNGGTFACPVGASQLQLGVNDAFSFSDNTGAWVFNVNVQSNAGESVQSIILMPCFNAGDARAQKKFGDVFIEAGPSGGS